MNHNIFSATSISFYYIFGSHRLLACHFHLAFCSKVLETQPLLPLLSYQRKSKSLAVRTQTRPILSTDGDMDSMNETARAAARQEDTTRPTTCDHQEKENTHQRPASPAVEESLEARLERLGRQRPDVFHSIWAEIGFVFSISMSQVLSVRDSMILPYRI